MIARLVNLWNTEPIAVLGILGTVAVFALEQFVGHGILSADTVESLKNLGTALAPFIIAIIGRTQVSPTPPPASPPATPPAP